MRFILYESYRNWIDNILYCIMLPHNTNLLIQVFVAWRLQHLLVHIIYCATPYSVAYYSSDYIKIYTKQILKKKSYNSSVLYYITRAVLNSRKSALDACSLIRISTRFSKERTRTKTKSDACWNRSINTRWFRFLLARGFDATLHCLFTPLNIIIIESSGPSDFHPTDGGRISIY